MTDKDVLYIVIPAYNEEANIERVVNDWYPVIEKHAGGGSSRLVIIDDGSKDHTYAILESLKKNLPLLECITKKNSGHGSTVLYGYKYAISNNADYVFQTDSDGQTDPNEFEQFWEHRDINDMTIGWRKGRQDGFSRVIVTKVLKLVIRMCFHVTVIDANTPYRLMRADILKQYLDLVPDDFNLSNVLITVIYYKKRRKVQYIPITFRPRQGGKNSINMRRIFRIGKQAIFDFKRINKILDESK